MFLKNCMLYSLARLHVPPKKKNIWQFWNILQLNHAKKWIWKQNPKSRWFIIMFRVTVAI